MTRLPTVISGLQASLTSPLRAGAKRVPFSRPRTAARGGPDDAASAAGGSSERKDIWQLILEDNADSTFLCPSQ
jgi:hypothetical protein